MRLKRIQNDFRVFEVLDEDLQGPGPYTLYRVTKRGLTTFEAADVLARLAGVERSAVAWAGLKDKDGVTGQFMTVEKGRRVHHDEGRLTLKPVGPAPRALESSDNQANSFEIVVRDLRADDMRRLRVNLDQVRRAGLPAYFDDQRFGCLRHGQGFVVRDLLRGDNEGALRALLCAPSPYGSQPIEQYKERIARAWGDWDALARLSRGRRGASAFAHLQEEPDDFEGALVRGISTRERTIHLFAWQSHLWNRAAARLVRDTVAEERISWLPGDDGSLPVPLELEPEERASLAGRTLMLFGAGDPIPEQDRALYEPVFRAERIDPQAFLDLDLSGFRPQAEPRPLFMEPQHLRAAPAQEDEIYKRSRKMRVRFTLPRGQYATLVMKRLLMPTDPDGRPLHLWVSRHRLDFPDSKGRMRRGSARRPGRRGDPETPGSKERPRGNRQERRGTNRPGPRPTTSRGPAPRKGS